MAISCLAPGGTGERWRRSWPLLHHNPMPSSKSDDDDSDDPKAEPPRRRRKKKKGAFSKTVTVQSLPREFGGTGAVDVARVWDSLKIGTSAYEAVLYATSMHRALPAEQNTHAARHAHATHMLAFNDHSDDDVVLPIHTCQHYHTHTQFTSTRFAKHLHYT